MAGATSKVERVLRRARDDVRRRRLEAGESGWGPPAPAPAVLPVRGEHPARAALIGAGRQGGHLAVAVEAITGADLVGIVDLDRERARALADRLGVSSDRCHDDVASLFAATPVDLAMIATTAPHHVALGRAAKAAGARRLLLEKPIDTSYADAAAFVAECEADGVPLGVNYFRRWMGDYRAIAAAIADDAIGPVRIITAQVGAGELAMLASHYVDFARQILGEDPVSVSADLREPKAGNLRGADYDDPTGHLVVRFSGGARAYVDVEDDVPRGDSVLTIRGDHGVVVIEENRALWTLRTRSGRTWTFPFAGVFRPDPISTEVVRGMLAEDEPACSGADALVALEVILGAHHSNEAGGRRISLPLTDEQRALVARFA